MFVSKLLGLALAALAIGGCTADERIIDTNSVCCEIYSGSTLFGHGVLVGATDNGKSSVAVLTARHVITGCHGAPITIIVKNGETNKPLCLNPDFGRRWQTINDKAVDSTWLVLNQDELKKSGPLKYAAISANYTDFSMPKRNAAVRLGNERSDREYQAYTEDVPMTYPWNRILTNAIVRGGVISNVTERSQSGSPVFKVDEAGNAVRLLGTSTGSNSNNNITIFMTILDIHSALYSSLTGGKADLLCDLCDFW